MRALYFLLGWLAIFNSGAASAQNAWTHGAMVGNEGTYAGTLNDSGATFGQYCYLSDESCYWAITNQLECVAGETYAALVSSPVSSNHIELVCAGQRNGAWRYFVKPFDTIEQIVASSDFMGVATGTAAGLFQVNRFSLSGANAAIKRGSDLYKTLPRKPSTKDRTL